MGAEISKRVMTLEEEGGAALMCMKQSGFNVCLSLRHCMRMRTRGNRMGAHIGLAFAPFKDLNIA